MSNTSASGGAGEPARLTPPRAERRDRRPRPGAAGNLPARLALATRGGLRGALRVRRRQGRKGVMPLDASSSLREKAHRLIPGGAHTYAKGDDQFPEIA